MPVFLTAAVVAAVLAAVPLLVDADDPVAHALDEAAALVAEPAKSSLRGGADLRRNVDDVPLDRPTALRVKTTWQALLRLAEARVRLERTRPIVAGPALAEAASTSSGAEAPSAAQSVRAMLDQRIAEHVTVLGRAYTAVDTVSAARLGLDDAALKNVESIGESLDEVSRALVEVREEGRA